MVRSKVSEGLVLASAAKTVVAENASNGMEDLANGWTPLGEGKGSPNVTKKDGTAIVKDLGIDPTTGEIEIVYNDVAKSVKLTLTPSANGNPLGGEDNKVPEGAITWSCAVDKADNAKYVPANCRNTAASASGSQ
ncbi:pilin [Eleftheria terrae]|nr:pilin [Eleftheria terrae]